MIGLPVTRQGDGGRTGAGCVVFTVGIEENFKDTCYQSN